jgi:hypothetical protein
MRWLEWLVLLVIMTWWLAVAVLVSGAVLRLLCD